MNQQKIKTFPLMTGLHSVYVNEICVGTIKKQDGFWNFYDIENERVYGVFGKTLELVTADLEKHFNTKKTNSEKELN